MESQRKILVVTGATGNHGKAVLNYFNHTMSSHRYELRGITRNTDSETSKELSASGIEMVQADLGDLSSLVTAFAGATHIFATTDSNQLIFNAIENPSILSNGQTAASYAREHELSQGQNIADAASSIAGTLRRIVWSSLPSPEKISNGKYSKVSMFDAKDDIAKLLASKDALKEKLSVLLVGFYATNALNMPALYAPSKVSDGTYELAIPMSGDTEVPIADLEADMGPWVVTLFEANPGTVLVGATENLTWPQWLEKWARHNGVVARYRRAEDEEYGKTLEGLSEVILEEFAFIEEYGFAGSGAVYPDELRRRGVALPKSSVDDHISRCDWSSIL
ncbi:hypothetical protein DOTSEDRAFT_129965 [Dothistroma septosporum NZE10]|uniref:NmrA-like domain-containing protein n=1 Tax=Dothistroma septosporum (strain NZE10 / CBS 128990) TaxID=675120 RepID=N1PP85_DOTSN|nr:hypothetical protein DOTSEDRAFT_129965 [Dothistroma septosporum NZE10]